jgi:hypothetical protein
MRMRLDGKFPVNELQPFLHAGEAQAVTFERLLDVKSDTRISHG